MMTLSRRTYLFLYVVLLSFSMMANAAPRTKTQMIAAAADALQASHSLHAPSADGRELVVLKSNPSVALIGYADGAYAVVTADDRFPAIVASGKGVYNGLAKGVYVIRNNESGLVKGVSKK